MQPRQLLPPEAFISLEEIIAEDAYDEGLRIICVSYPWLEVGISLASHIDYLGLSEILHATHSACGCLCTQPGHPDPKRFNLGKIAFVLKKYLAKGGRWAVFWEYLRWDPNCQFEFGTCSH
eukprot:70741-Prymnesium_polylepis.1